MAVRNTTDSICWLTNAGKMMVDSWHWQRFTLRTLIVGRCVCSRFAAVFLSLCCRWADTQPSPPMQESMPNERNAVAKKCLPSLGPIFARTREGVHSTEHGRARYVAAASHRSDRPEHAFQPRSEERGQGRAKLPRPSTGQTGLRRRWQNNDSLCRL